MFCHFFPVIPFKFQIHYAKNSNDTRWFINYNEDRINPTKSFNLLCRQVRLICGEVNANSHFRANKSRCHFIEFLNLKRVTLYMLHNFRDIKEDVKTIRNSIDSRTTRRLYQTTYIFILYLCIRACLDSYEDIAVLLRASGADKSMKASRTQESEMNKEKKFVTWPIHIYIISYTPICGLQMLYMGDKYFIFIQCMSILYESIINL